MSTGEMKERITEASPRFKARIAGGLWLMVIDRDDAERLTVDLPSTHMYISTA